MGTPVRSATATRLALGGLCLAMPTTVLRLLGSSDRDDPVVLRTARVLGARLVVQAGLDLTLGPRTRRADIVVDLTHATSMVPVALLWPRHRRTALASAAMASTVALLDLRG